MKHTVFAFEACARMEPESVLHQNLLRLLGAQPKEPNHQQKWTFYRDCAGEILAAQDRVTRFCWDYFDDDKMAVSNYDEWVAGMTTAEGARAQPSGAVDPYRGGDPRWLTFTMAFLLVKDSGCDESVRDQCAISEEMLWHRDTMRRVLGAVPMLNFAVIKSDVAYLIPRDDAWGLTGDDLAQPKFNYLRPIVG
jgi:hypothetical protein